MVDNFDLIMAADPDTLEALKIFNEYSNKNKNIMTNEQLKIIASSDKHCLSELQTKKHDLF